MDGYQRRTEEKKRQIFDAARELFGKHGFKKVTVDEVADRAGVSKVTIYTYFNSKVGLIRALVDETFRERKSAIEELIHSDRPFLEKLNALTVQKADASASYSREFLRQIVEHPAWRNQPAEELDAFVAELMEQGKREGYVSERASLRALRLYVDIFRAGTEGMAEMLSALSPDEQKQIIAMFFHGLSAPL
jgi:AcrR family transcriptional regulator